jgi:hypothetical protein
MYKKLFNFHESVTHVRLRDVCDRYGASVYPKIRLADVFIIENSGISNDEYRFALQSHFDFVVYDTSMTPLFAVEFDGPSHQENDQRRRDKIKNGLCDRFSFPLLRIQARHVNKDFRGMDLLSWFINVWFLQRAFDTQQETGAIPWDDWFDPASVVTLDVTGPKYDFPLFLSMEIRRDIEKLYKSGKCRDPFPNFIWGKDNDQLYRAVAWLSIDGASGVFTETRQC